MPLEYADNPLYAKANGVAATYAIFALIETLRRSNALDASLFAQVMQEIGPDLSTEPEPGYEEQIHVMLKHYLKAAGSISQ